MANKSVPTSWTDLTKATRAAQTNSAGKDSHAALTRECAILRAAKPRVQLDQLITSAFSLGQLVERGELKRREVEQALSAAVSTWEFAAKKGPWTLQQIKRIICSGLQAGMEQSRRGVATEKAPQQSGCASALADETSRSIRKRPSIDAGDGDLARQSDAAWTAILSSNDPPWLFRYGNLPCRLEFDDQGTPAIVPLTEDRLRGHLAREIDWFKFKNHIELTVHPPVAVVRDILARPNKDLPVLQGVVSTPFFGPDGTLQVVPGYHESSRLLYQPSADLKVPEVSVVPTTAEMHRALSLITYELLGDFPFVSDAERANAIGMLVAPFVRPMIDGATPLHLIEKPSPGTGASLMLNAIATIATGANAHIMTEGRDEDEWRKRITATLRSNETFVVFDNVRRKLDSSSLAAVITAPAWTDRILGRSETMRLPVRCVWVATGNNPSLSHEMARRTVRIRIDAKKDQPWRRTGFKHKDLIRFTREERGELIWAVLTLVQSWIDANRPRPDGLPTLGMFESWAETVGGILAHAGIDGFLGNLQELYESSDSEGAVWRNFVAAWWEHHYDKAVGVADLFDLSQKLDPPVEVGNGSDRSQRTRLGKQLAKMRDRQFTVSFEGGFQVNLRLCAGEKGTGARSGCQLWRLERVVS